MDRSTPIDQRSYQSARVLYEKRAGHSTIPFHSLSLSLCMIDRPDRVRVRSAEKTIVARIRASRYYTFLVSHKSSGWSYKLPRVPVWFDRSLVTIM